MITTILFDLMGTLVEETERSANLRSETQIKAIHESLTKDGIVVNWDSFRKEYEEARRLQMAASKKSLKEYDMCQRISTVLSVFSHTVPPTSAYVRRALDAYMGMWIDTLTVDEAVYPVLKELKERYKLGMVTNNPYSPGVHRTLDRFNLRPFFATVVVSSDCGWRKPSSYIFEAALHNLSSNPMETIFFGDDCEGDIYGARQVGMRTVYKSMKGDRCEMADFTIESLIELPPIIKRF